MPKAYEAMPQFSLKCGGTRHRFVRVASRKHEVIPLFLQHHARLALSPTGSTESSARCPKLSCAASKKEVVVAAAVGSENLQRRPELLSLTPLKNLKIPSRVVSFLPSIDSLTQISLFAASPSGEDRTSSGASSHSWLPFLSFWRTEPTQSRSICSTSRNRMDAPLTFAPRDGSASSLSRGRGGLVTASDLKSIQGLKVWLGERIPCGTSVLETWGSQRGTKCLANLWTELLEGEACLSDSSPPSRAVNVVSVRVTHPKTGRFLVEASQEMQDGSIRVRNRPLSEKMRPGESVEEAALRGVFEELGADYGCASKVTILPETIQTRVEQRDSFSYPGLPSVYTVHTIVAHIDDLPEGPFQTVENEGGSQKSRGGTLQGLEGDPLPSDGDCLAGVHAHCWDWVDTVPRGK